MSTPSLRRNALAAAVLSIVFAAGAAAQSAGSSSSSSTPPASGTTATGTSAGSTAGTSSTAGTAGGGAAAKSTLDRADRKFLEEAAMGGMAEVELGNLAKQKAGSDQVKQFGERMATDHGKANEQLKQTVAAKGLQAPTALDKKHQKELDRLQKLSGAEFDREYMKHMVSDHKKDVSEFQKAAKSAKDSDVKSFASSTLPTLQEHLKLAQSVNDSMKGTKSGKTASSGSGSINASGTGTAPARGSNNPYAGSASGAR